MRAFRWLGKREKAALLVAQDEISDQAIANSLGINEATLERWKARPEFQARVASIVEETRKAVLARGIADKRARIAALDEDWRRLRRVVEARAEHHPQVKDADIAAGAETGALVLTIRYLPGGGRVEEWAVDTALFAEIRAQAKQAAIELGEWTEKSESRQTGDINYNLRPDLSRLSLEELRSLERILAGPTDAPTGEVGDREA